MYYEIPRKYIGLPHINGAKNKAYDCCTLIAQIYEDMGHPPFEIEYGYPANWMLYRNELLLPYLERYFERIDTLEVGCVISYRWGRSEYAHLSLYLGDGKVIHSMADRGVEIVEIDNPIFDNRMTGIWKLKEVK